MIEIDFVDKLPNDCVKCGNPDPYKFSGPVYYTSYSAEGVAYLPERLIYKCGICGASFNMRPVDYKPEGDEK